ncbi:phage tail protein, partial [Escherichia coli]|nr:phage tail protein [Escherichia coli]MCV4945390.1 phage tail protein [Escherichia coli]
QNDVTLKMPAFEWVHVQLHQQKGMISLSPPTICNSAVQLSSDTNSTSETLAATPKAVKAAYDLAAGKAPSSHT